MQIRLVSILFFVRICRISNGLIYPKKLNEVSKNEFIDPRNPSKIPGDVDMYLISKSWIPESSFNISIPSWNIPNESTRLFLTAELPDQILPWANSSTLSIVIFLLFDTSFINLW